MADSVKNKVAEAGQTVADTAKNVGHKIVEGVEHAADWVKDKTGVGCSSTNVGVAGIKEHMDVIASCGKKIGVVDHMDGGAIKLTRKDSPDNQHHFIPTGWVDHVDNHVHLTKNSVEAVAGWKAEASSCGCS